MAKRMKSKIQPAVMKMYFNFTHQPAGANQKKYIDISQCASLLNRRFYRQGLNWAVSGFKVLNSKLADGTVTTGSVSISKLPNTWVMSNSWEKGFRSWQKMIKNAVDESDQQSLKGKFLDFKIYMNDGHHSAGFKENMRPIDASGNAAERGEWIPATLEMPVTREITALPQKMGETIEYQIIATGDNYPGPGGDTGGKDAVSLIQGYALSRALPSQSDPNTPALSSDAAGVTPENWLAALFNDGVAQDSGVLEDIAEYDQPPYPYEGDGGIPIGDSTKYPGGGTQLPGLEIHDIEYITGTTVGGTTRLSGGNFPCGLIEINTTMDQGAVPIILEVSLVPGNHRGYLCEPMTEM